MGTEKEGVKLMDQHRHTLEPWKHDNGDIIIADWAQEVDHGTLKIFMGEGPVPMHNTDATAWKLVTSHKLGVDHITVPAGSGFPPHTHPGDHLLIVIAGRGTITVDGKIYPTHGGQVYFVPGDKTHAVGAIDEHHILAVGAPHRLPDDPERMALVEYASIASEIGELECGVCGARGKLNEIDCPHLPAVAK
jgi:quercetin dioxygenase-like cupin family protein